MTQVTTTSTTIGHGAAWPQDEGPYVALVDASSALETEIIESWIQKATKNLAGTIDVFRLQPSRRGRASSKIDPAMDERFALPDDPLCVPVRVAWLAAKQDGVRKVRLSDLLKPGDPRDPNAVVQRYILARHPDRVRVVVGEPARRSELEKRWTAPTGRGPKDGTTFGEYVTLQAWMSLERSERHLRGLQYKVPKFLGEDLFWSKPFQSGLERLAKEMNKPKNRMQRRTARYLKEIAAQHSPYTIDVVNGLTTLAIKAAHHSVDYSEAHLREVYDLAEHHPLVFLPSHKSNFDHLVFQHVLYENGLPLNHTAGGMNMNFLLIGPLLRRAGIFFIRREFRDNEPYKFVLRQYIDYLLEKRFALEWYIEGGRSRTGKLREPRLGLLAYVADSFQRGITDDVILVPVSINYDQITDVGSYSKEQRGGKKEAESFAWALRFLASFRRQNGRIYLRFGEPLPLSNRIDRSDDLSSEAGRLILPKIAFEISTRINAVTPITAISMVTLALLSQETRGLTVQETALRIIPFMTFVSDRNLPLTDDLPFASDSDIAAALDALVVSNVVHKHEGLVHDIYTIAPGQHHAAAYYRNTVIHFFVNAAITEVAVGLCTTRSRSVDAASITEIALEIRDLLKFEFFFSSATEFAEDIISEIQRHATIDPTTGDISDFDLDLFHPMSPMVLRPFLESYFVIAATLVFQGSKAVSSEELAKQALLMGREFSARGYISSKEAVSVAIFTTGIKLAESRGLLDADIEQRRSFHDSLREILELLDTIARQADTRHAFDSHLP